MSDILCVNTHKLYHIVLSQGGDIEEAKAASIEINQPSKGYYAITDIYKFMERKQSK